MRKCLICAEKFTDKADLFSHYENKHSSEFEEGWSGAKCHFFKNYGRVTGRCKTCGKTTNWNNATDRPHVFCKNPKCREEYRAKFVNNMKKKYGKEHLLNDPEVQKKMLFNRGISGEYTWSDHTKKKYVGSFEKDFLQFLDKFMEMDSNDVLVPAPQIVDYVDADGVKRFYIPDVYIASLNLVVEIKDGGDNPNTHPKIMAVDKVKEKLKDEAIKKLDVNYIKIENKNYHKFLDFLNNLKLKEEIDNDNRRVVKFSEGYIPAFNYSFPFDKFDIYVYKRKVDELDPLSDNTILDCGIIDGEGANIIVFNGLQPNDNTGLRYTTMSLYEDVGKSMLNSKYHIYKVNPESIKHDHLYSIAVQCSADPEVITENDFICKIIYRLTGEYYPSIHDMMSDSNNCLTRLDTDSIKFIINPSEQNVISESATEKFVKDIEKFINDFKNNGNVLPYNLNESTITINEYYGNNISDHTEEVLSESYKVDNLSVNSWAKRPDVVETSEINTYKNMQLREYCLLIDNSIKRSTLIIIEALIVKDEKLTREDKMKLLGRLKRKYDRLDDGLSDKLDVTVLPYKMKQSINLFMDKLEKENDNLMSKYNNYITATNLKESREGIEYLRDLRKGAEQLEAKEKEENISEMISENIRKYYGVIL